MSTICQLHADLRYYLCMQPVDMRKQFQGLQGIINAEFGRYITQDEAFIFVGKTGTTVNGGGVDWKLTHDIITDTHIDRKLLHNMIYLKRTFHPVGQGAFFTEQFYDGAMEHVLYNVVYDCGSKSPGIRIQMERDIRNSFH